MRWPRDARVDFKVEVIEVGSSGAWAGSLTKVGISSCILKGESGCDFVAQDIA